MDYPPDTPRHEWRREWVFDIPSGELVKAADDKVKHHRDRLKYWDEKHQELRDKYIKSVEEAAKDATEKEAKDAADWAELVTSYQEGPGVEFATSSPFSNKLSAGAPRRREIIGDPEIYEELQKALLKVNEHRTAVEEFSRWAKALRREDKTLPVTIRDLEYFGF